MNDEVYKKYMLSKKLSNIRALLTLYTPIPKKVKHTQTIRRQFADQLFEWV